jgi:hypothetical protein
MFGCAPFDFILFGSAQNRFRPPEDPAENGSG